MFGHDDKQKHDDTQDEGAVLGTADQVSSEDQSDKPSGGDSWQHPGPPSDDDNDKKTDDFTAGHHTDSSDDDTGEPLDVPTTGHTPLTDADSSPVNASQHELIDIKQEALSKLTPLIGHLDQTPDEKFRTLMMMIQASDDQSLVRQAYETAVEIDDEKTRAQALLDIVNEINYFTQNPKPE